MRHFSLIAIASCASFVACAPAMRESAETPTKTDVITAEEISRAGYSNAWELLRKRARQYDFAEDQFGQPKEVHTRRGRSTISIASADTPLILIDGARVLDLGFLRDLSTGSIQSVELLGGIRGTVAQGTNAAAGVISIHTWEASQN
jgi:outer membrane cobalamin receptor